MAARRAGLAALALAVALAACSGDDDDEPRGAVGSTTGAPPVAEGNLPDGTHFGFVTALDPSSRLLVFDPAEIVDGEVENPDRTAHRLTMSTEIRVRLLKPCCDLHEHAFEAWLAEFQPDDRTFYGTAASRYEVTLDGGEVVLVEEVLVEG